MINAKGNLGGKIQSKQTINGSINKSIEYVNPITQEKEVVPTKEIQIIEPDKGYTGLSKVTVDRIADEYIIPTGSIEITSNGTHDITNKASVIVNVQPTLQEKSITISVNGTNNVIADDEYYGLSKVNIITNIPEKKFGIKNITENGSYNASTDNLDGYSSVDVNVPEKQLGTKTITSNGTYKATDDELDGYSEVEVSTSGVDINEYFTDTIGSGDSNVGGWVKTIKKLPSSFPIKGNSCSYMFSKYQGTILPQIDTSNITNMQGMFQSCSSLVSLDLSKFNTSKVTDMSGMFSNCSSLTSLDVSNFDTTNVTKMNGMFSSCNKLKELSVDNFNTSKVTNIGSMFQSCSSLVSLDLSNFNTSKVTNIGSMFQSCSSLVSLDLSNFDVSSIQSFSSLFANCYNLQTIDGGLLNAGKSYLTTISANHYYYRIDLSYCTKLTEQSIINVLTNLYDIKTKGCNAQQVVLGSTNLAKLTSEEGQQALSQATEFGWSIS